MKQIMIAASITGMMMWASVSFGQDVKNNQKEANPKANNIRSNKSAMQRPMQMNASENKASTAVAAKPGATNGVELTPSEKRHLRK